eukprot:jgi/Chrzof1/14993/Cz09g23150.t1
MEAMQLELQQMQLQMQQLLQQRSDDAIVIQQLQQQLVQAQMQAATANQTATAAAAAAAAAGVANMAAPPGGSAPKPSKPESYHGDNREDKMPVDNWVFQLERYFEACRPPVIADADRIKFAVSLLRGSAVDWWRQYLHNVVHNPGDTAIIDTWATFSTSLVAQFIPVDARLMARNKIASMRQTQSVSQFASAMRRTALRIPGITDDELKHRFISGLKPNIGALVRIQRPVSFAVAIGLAQEIDNAYSEHRLANSSNGNGSKSTGDTSAPMELNATRAAGFDGVCYNCGKKGHMAKDCWSKKGKPQGGNFRRRNNKGYRGGNKRRHNAAKRSEN